MSSSTRQELLDAVKHHGVIILYLLQLAFILMYTEPEVQPFAYVRF